MPNDEIKVTSHGKTYTNNTYINNQNKEQHI